MGPLTSLILSLFLFCSFSLTHSRTTPQGPKTTVLDVASSLQNAHKVLTLNHQLRHHQQLSLSSFTLQLHSRVSIQKPSNTDYKSLTLLRLERDSARVRSLQTRLDLALKRISESDLHPAESGNEFQSEELQGPIVSGTSQGSGEYFLRLGIGKPPSPAYVVLDTGSDVSWIQCAPCADCYQQSDPIFDPNSSDSYSPIHCDAPQCKSLDLSECRNGTCLYEVSYGDGSYTVGEFATETVSFGSASVDGVAIGCGHNNEGLFVGAAGLLGLGGGSLSFPAQLNATSFSYCLVDRDSDSASTLEFDSPLPRNTVSAPLRRNPQLDTFYYLGMTGLSVGGELLPIPETSFAVDSGGGGGIIVDSGTAVTRLRSEVYDELRDAFVRGTRGLPAANGVSLFDTCYDLSSRSSVEVPTVSFHFPDGKELPLPAKNYLIPVDSVGTFCFAFAPTTSSLSIIGNVQQQGTRVGFDIANSLIGFSSNSC
ncbi:protein ASPARTIC PROTEASE IN GUARD CELL 1 [Gastrolobium bilobum]|uniref:protein ASPARTIC PROTEASE IN GUARD CELL 1 n=1 Tax=Gastrolobium bilobum TaxID=150636 RepID=UPI002AB105B4|nr:protein ASPARTIC PROTEASE IN GUARD CELL 1 [Gastrolobium bilobum]